MYVIKVDGQVLYSPALSDAHHVISPSLSLEVNKAGSLSFIIPPGHAMYDAIHKMKSVITVEQDGEVIFRGRVLEKITDFYNQTEYFCEGDLVFLSDSIQRPYEFSGTAAEFFNLMIANHNQQVDDGKKFTVGSLTAVDSDEILEFDLSTYSDTASEIESVLLDAFGGYLRTRFEDGVNYIDYVDALNTQSNQTIEFGVNMLDLENQLDAQEVFTVIVPLGATQDDGKELTVASVNDGLDYIENTEAIEKFGRIWKAFTWENCSDPQHLLELGQEALQNAVSLETLTIKAVDLHLVNVDTDIISLGDNVHILSFPHGLDKSVVCSAIDIDIQNPENTSFTFGLPKETLTDSLAAHSKDIKRNHSHITETQYGLNITIGHTSEVMGRVSQVELDMDAANAAILLKADQSTTNWLTERVNSAEVKIDGANARIDLKADSDVVTALESDLDKTIERVTSAEIAIDGANAAIKLKADKTETDELGERISTAEADIDAANAAINLLANASDLSSLESRVSSAEIAIDGMEAQIALKASQETVNEQEERLSTAEANIDAANAAITLKADKTVTDDLGERMSTAEAEIDAANAAITLKAEKSVVDEQGERLSTAEADIDAANAAIALKAEKSAVDAQGERLNTAEANIDAANAAIKLKADASTVTSVEKRVSSAEANIDAANAEILLRAKTSTVDTLTGRVSAAEASIVVNAEAITSKVSKDGVISSINQTAESVTISASKINLSGYVTTSKLSSEIASINTAISTSVVTSSVSANSVSCNSLTLSDASLRLRTGSFVTAVTLPKVSGKYISYMDDTMDVVQQYVLTGFTQGEVTTSSLVYCGTT